MLERSICRWFSLKANQMMLTVLILAPLPCIAQVSVDMRQLQIAFISSNYYTSSFAVADCKLPEMKFTAAGDEIILETLSRGRLTFTYRFPSQSITPKLFAKDSQIWEISGVQINAGTGAILKYQGTFQGIAGSKIRVIESTVDGRILVKDGVIQGNGVSSPSLTKCSGANSEGLSNQRQVKSDLNSIETEISSLFRDEAYLNSIVDPMNLPAERGRRLKEFTRDILKQPEVVSAIASEVRGAGDLANQKVPQDYWKRVGEQLFLSVGQKGLNRLATQDQREVLIILRRYLDKKSSYDCARIVNPEKGGSNSDAMADIFVALDDDQLDRYLQIIKVAILSELRKFPIATSLSKEQRDLAVAAFQRQVSFRRQKGEVSEDMLKTMSNMNSSDMAKQCSAGKAILDTVLSMEGVTGELMLAYYFAMSR